MKEHFSNLDNVLLTFIDPLRITGSAEWAFIDYASSGYKSAFKNSVTDDATNLIVCFSRRYLIDFVLFALKVKFLAQHFRIRKILYINDGLLSSLFDVKNTKGYRRFSKIHLPETKGLMRTLISHVPLLFRAEQRFVILERHSEHNPPTTCMNTALEGIDFVMYSNATGKLMLARSETFLTGKGQIIKTTANSDYVPVMKREYETVLGISTRIRKKGYLPKLGKCFESKGTFIFTEDYINGKSLRDILNAYAMSNASHKACSIINRLDEWYSEFCCLTSPIRKKLSFLYDPVMSTFIELYGEHEEIYPILHRITKIMNIIDATHLGLTPKLSHNDLWPGNLIVTSDDIIAIDWERATENHSGIFDYYWMMISAAIVYLKDAKGLPDYSHSFKLFLKGDDDISLCVHNKLSTFIISLGFNHVFCNFFLALFLLEWSVQGYTHINKTNAMDELAFKELLSYSEEYLYPLSGLGG